jgi:diguanylate cyclase (GGDEF)-like protein
MAWIGVADPETLKIAPIATDLAGEIGFALDHIHKEERLSCLLRLPNRMHFLGRINKLIRTRGAGKEMIAVALVDIDRFRSVNDTLGHKAGDELLKLVVQRIHLSGIDIETAARVGVNCFGVAARNPRDAESVRRTAGPAARAFS